MFKKLSKESKFIINYFKKFQTFLELDKQTLNKILLVKNILLDCQKKNNKVIVVVNPKYYRPSEVDLLLGDPKKAESCLNWKRKVDFPSLVEMMVTNDIKQYKKQL